MRTALISLLAGTLLVGMSLAQDPSQPQSPSASSPIPSGTTLYAELDKSVDAKKAKQGDPVVAKTTQALLSQGRVVIPKGTKIIGHVTEAKPRTKEQPQSSLSLAFDHAVMKDGTQMPMAASIQALAPAATVSLDQTLSGQDPGYGNTSGTRPSHGGMGGNGVGGMRTNVGTAPDPGSNSSGQIPASTDPQVASGGHLNPKSHGVIGLSGLTLAPPTGNSAQITSDRKNVKLDGGTEMLLRVN